MNLAEALVKTATNKGPACSVCAFVASRTDDQHEVQAHMLNEGLQYNHLTRAVEKMTEAETGQPVRLNPQAIKKHRERGGRCRASD